MHLAAVARFPVPSFRYFGMRSTLWRMAPASKGNYDWSQVDRVDEEQAVDIRRLIACVQELQDK